MRLPMMHLSNNKNDLCIWLEKHNKNADNEEVTNK